jgi:hypothetical protein
VERVTFLTSFLKSRRRAQGRIGRHGQGGRTRQNIIARQAVMVRSGLGSALLGRYANQYTKLIDLTGEIQGVRFQDVHGMTPVTFMLKFGDPFVKCVKIVTQFLN